jgi:hypothetical protein
LHLDVPDATYTSGELIEGTVRVRARDDCTCEGITLRRRWRAEGRGSADRGGEHTIGLSAGEQIAAGAVRDYPFSIPAPPEPFTYDGHLFDLHWHLDVAVALSGRPDATVGQRFRLEPDIAASERPYSSGGTEVTPEVDAEAYRQLGVKTFYGCSLLTGLSLFTFGTVMIVGGVLQWDAVQWKAFVFLGVGAALLLGAFVILGAGIYKHFSEQTFREVEARLVPWSARPGEDVTVHLRLVPDRRITVRGLRARLEGKERVIHRQSEPTRTWTEHEHVFHDEAVAMPVSKPTREAGVPVAWEATLPVPPDAPFSLEEYNNRVEWTVALLLDLDGRPEWTTRLALTVRP